MTVKGNGGGVSAPPVGLQRGRKARKFSRPKVIAEALIQIKADGSRREESVFPR
jgi:hypothetical protein